MTLTNFLPKTRLPAKKKKNNRKRRCKYIFMYGKQIDISILKNMIEKR